MPRSLRQALDEDRFAITAEVGPPKGTDVGRLIEQIELLKPEVDALNVTDNQSAVMKLSPLAACKLIVDRGGDAVLQLTCRDRNRLALQSDLLAAWVLGVRNVLALSGDYVLVGDHPQAKPVFDLDSVQLLQTIELLNAGRDLAGNELRGGTGFLAGAAVTPEADPLEPQLLKFEKKIVAGARFFQTQAVFDVERFEFFMQSARKHEVKVLAGIVLLASARMARYMNEKVPGIEVPDALIARLDAAGKDGALEVGIEIAAQTIRRLRQEQICDGVHVMAIGREQLVPQILAAAQ
ncbi:MAG: methylenetetrahydrofolate reductase [Candidatus Alcyoniella australis]|nr:methylenetetrahydrofolate reductase [Candidatus Alcyoniella australis]